MRTSSDRRQTRSRWNLHLNILSVTIHSVQNKVHTSDNTIIINFNTNNEVVVYTPGCISNL